MSTLVTTCPHCLAEQMTMRSVSSCRISESSSTAIFACGGCHGIYCVVLLHAGKLDWIDFHGNFHDLLSYHGGAIVRKYPRVEAKTCPESVPDNVRRAFLQGVDNAARGNSDAAAAMFRKSLEVATRALDPGLAGKKLVARIDALEAAGRLTPDLKTWAHLIRLDGNNGAHDEEELPAAQIEQLQKFSELFLIYTFTLPAEVAARRAMALPPE
ncbi:DUF4145 domain-containing protein [Xanthomonas euvesicatoria]|uniref:DUF4145 domain-containing protein n=1 Tax=Xanthomonas euvesicatoria TaxID=456327 RepID=UPI001C44BDC6|nr:DUF4145 domain-containing protein [Xanthomonas euvesicatoria]MBV6794297.1 DUF4145 domain-containing protein [Xanthomonas campestris pv. daturae]